MPESPDIASEEMEEESAVWKPAWAKPPLASPLAEDPPLAAADPAPELELAPWAAELAGLEPVPMP